MRVYLSSVFDSVVCKEKNYEEYLKDIYILHSFAYAKDKYVKYYNLCKGFMMDSGAFTIMNSKKSRNSFNPLEFTKSYANHIKKNKVKNFLELDIDGVYGFEIYKDCLHCLEDITGQSPIPVFHKWRGINYYKALVKKYDYIAIGDSFFTSNSLYEYYLWFVEEAHKNNCRVHGLAFTNLNKLQYIPFDSVDSSSWKSGPRFARPSLFNGHTLNFYDARKTDKKQLSHNKEVFLHDFLEWKKLAVYYDSQYEPIW